MSPVRQSAPGATRTCPHCRQTILESASVCPACRHHLRFEADRAETPRSSVSALRVEGTIQHPNVSEPWEYMVLLSIRDERGEEITRHVAGVGAMRASERRSFTFAVEIYEGK